MGHYTILPPAGLQANVFYIPSPLTKNGLVARPLNIFDLEHITMTLFL